ncbi:PIN domain-containing protein [Thiothrix lacustris]|uniref:PIN domain-containing protein n=1 Tax=Thiothrix lacustris TaxID=525917 RepID=A0ABY9MPS8_9GAMM|nr:PIN domain-containing protein [Thiothrix lacustris]WML90397.1 PIN domain-containing protein [Thiothrix lacustris]
MNLFFDTSALVKYFHPETGTAHVIELMENASNTIWVSDLARIEFISALYRKFRRGYTKAPLGNIHNQRSLVALPNLIDLITTCIDHPAAANQTFLVSDGEDLSTTQLLQRLSHALGKPARLLPSRKAGWKPR